MLTKAQAELLDMLAAGAIYGAEQVGNMEAAERLKELRKEAELTGEAEEQRQILQWKIWAAGRAEAYEMIASDLRRWMTKLDTET